MKKYCLILALLGAGWLLMPAGANAGVLPTTAPLRAAEQATAGFYISFGSGGCYRPPVRCYTPPPCYRQPVYYRGGGRNVYYRNYNYRRGCR